MASHMDLAELYAARAGVPKEYVDTVKRAVFLALCELSNVHARLLEQEGAAWGDDTIRPILIRVSALLRAKRSESVKMSRSLQSARRDRARKRAPRGRPGQGRLHDAAGEEG